MVYPNPTNGKPDRDFGSLITGNATLVIADVAGRAVFTADMNVSGAKTHQFDVTALQQGLYILTIKSDAGVCTTELEVAK
jgi:hypothetical protein